MGPLQPRVHDYPTDCALIPLVAAEMVIYSRLLDELK